MSPFSFYKAIQFSRISSLDKSHCIDRNSKNHSDLKSTWIIVNWFKMWYLQFYNISR